MNNLKIYQDSKELPLWNYKRIIQTGDFCFMIKGYDIGDDKPENLSELEEKFKQIEQDAVISINDKNFDLILIGKIEKSKAEINLFLFAMNVISLKQEQKKLCDKLELDFDYIDVFEMLKPLKIQKFNDLDKQKESILNRIKKLENDIQDSLSRIKDNEKKEEEFDIDKQIISVKIGLEIDFNEEKTSIYQYNHYCKALVAKIDEINKIKTNG